MNNYSFEDSIFCPTNAGQLNSCIHWFNPVAIGSPDYFSSCANSNTLAAPNGSRIAVPQNEVGFQVPKTGNGYGGFATFVPSISDFREYVKTKLNSPLIAGKNYCVSFFISLSDSSEFATANIGGYFSNDSMINSVFSPPYLINVVPDIERTSILNDSLNWVKVEGVYAAISTKAFFTIGNFRSDANTSKIQIKPLHPNPLRLNYSFYYVDDVSVVEINPARASLKDSLFKCALGNVVLGTDSTWDATYSWFPTTGLSCTNCPNPVASPTVTTKYYLTKQQCSATTMDSVIVSIISPTIIADAGINSTIHCVNDSLVLGSDNNAIYTYSWSPTNDLNCSNCANPVASPSVTTMYYLNKKQCGVSAKDSILVTVTSATTPANAGPDKMICPGDLVQIGTDSIPNIIYNWQNIVSLSCTNCPRPMANPDSTTSYILSRQECAFVANDTVKIAIDDCDPTFIIPNVFSPNGDGVNDTWGINFSSVHHIKDFSLQIFNRWGLQVFSTNPELSTPNLKWDGRTSAGVECSAGTYFYVITFKKNDEEKKIKGFLNLFR